MDTAFLTAILDQGIDNPNFFNGKVLTARDMRDVQTSMLQRSRRLGLALGEGVAYGLFVQQNSPNTLAISAGLAVNRRGDALLLPTDIILPMQSTSQVASPLDSPFGICGDGSTTTSIATGFYVVAVTLATQLSSERAQHSGLNTSDQICISRYEVEGVQFKLIPIDTGDFAPTGSETLYQNQLASMCFGTALLEANFDDPFNTPAYYGLIDSMRGSGRLLDCDVPLAVLRWTGSLLRFVDQWSVRRSCYGVSATAEYPLSVMGYEPFPQHVSARRRIEAQAMLMQFQDQLTSLPNNTDIAGYFVYLPSAGYVPTTASKYNLTTLFPNNSLTTRDLDPAYVRLLFQQSFFIDPVPVTPGQAVDIDFFRVLGAGNNFIVFARHEQVVVTTPPDDSVEPPPGAKEGTIIVTVTDPQGKTMLASDMSYVGIGGKDFVSAEKIDTVLYKYETATYNLVTTNLIKTYYQQARSKARTSEYLPGREDINIGIMVRPELAVYVFKRPPGTYTVTAIPKSKTGLRAGSATVTLGSGQTKNITIQLSTILIVWPPGGGKIKITPDDPWVLGRGFDIHEIFVYPDWKKRFPFDPGYVDPIPPEWQVDPPDIVWNQIDDILRQQVIDMPTLAVEGTQVFVNPDYDPGVVQDSPYAFLKTGDGQVIPLIFAAGEQAVTGDVTVGRTTLADLDPATQSALRDKGLDSLNAFNGAWTGLVSGILSFDQSGARSLLTETQGQAQNLKTSFTRYPGISTEADSALKGHNFGDDAALANASVDEVLAVLNAVPGANYTEGFVVRLIDRARGNVPANIWSLGTLGLSENQLNGLSTLGIDSVGEFLNATSQRHDIVASAMHISGKTLDQLANDARAGVLEGRLLLGGRAGVAAVEGVTPDVAGILVDAGYKTAGDLSNANLSDLATTLGVSEADAGALKVAAADRVGTLTIIQQEFGLTDNAVTRLRDAGIVGGSDLAAGGAKFNTIVGAERASIVKDVVGRALNKTGIIRGR